MVTASAVRPFEIKQGSQELIGLLAGPLVFGFQLAGCPSNLKLACNGAVGVDPAILLGILVLGCSAIVVMTV
jgi:hypothetical protein